MDLGRVKLMRSGVNVLHQAIHPVHGLAWTDGRQVILTALQFQKEEPEFGSSVVIGQFEHVYGLYWGPATDALALLAVQHKKRVTTWQLYYNPLEKNKLVVSQTCEYGDPLPILPQGCVWHPKKNVLVVLTKRDISVLYSVCYNNNNVKADITGSSVIRCACWAKDGNRMVVAMDDSLHSYIWNDDQKTLSPCSFCPIFNIDAAVVAIQPIMDCQVVVTLEIAVKSPYNKNKDSDGSALQSSLLILDKELSRNSRRMSIDSGKSEPVDTLKVSSLVPDVSQMLARHRKSDPSPLTYFKPKNILVEDKPELSSLVIVTFEKNATTTRTVSLPGIATPDILVLDPHCERVAVASNTCNLILIYPIAPSCMPNIQQIKLEEYEVAKGVSFLSDTLLLILVGRQKSNDMVFLPVLTSDKYMVQLVTRKIMPSEYIPARSNCGQNLLSGHSSFPTADCKQSSDEHNVSKEFWMPIQIGTEPPCVQRKSADIMQDTNCQQSPASSLDDLDVNKLVTVCPITIENLQSEPTILKTLKVQLGMPKKTLHRSFSQSSCNSDSQESRENHLPTLNKDGGEGTTDLGHRGKDSHLCSSEVNNCLKIYLRTLSHPSSEDPPYISVTHQISSDHGVNDIRAILLCHGNLRLRTLQEIFHLNNIEMKFGSKWIILTEDGEGFVPITFRANQEVVIREAKDHCGSAVICAESIGSTEGSEKM